ncbi:MAG: type I restriction endonuclease [Halofilum sp. (in: g-proteobacteria)]|nr:type I restriction endonuclease [Halofilum sp. (in: g-proteobacteria)]
MMPPPSPADAYSEDALIEQPAIELFADLDWDTAKLYGEWSGTVSSEGRQTQQDVVLVPRLRVALETLNPELPADVLEKAIEELTRDRSKLLAVNANLEIYRLLKDGVKVEMTDEDGGTTIETVRVIDWNQPEQNDFLLASQFWVRGELHTRRTDLVGFVNGLPLLFVELKASHKTLKAAYDGNLSDYRSVIPQLFTYNAVVMLSNGSETVVGSTFSPWEHLFEWKRINDEGEKGRGVPGDRHPRHRRSDAAAGHRGELHGVRGGPGRHHQEDRQEPSVPRCEQGHRRAAANQGSPER